MKKFIYTIVIIFTFFIGCISSYFTYNYLNKENSNVKSVMNEVSITESDSINASVNKIYDAVVLIEVYNKQNNLTASGTGFVYKKDSKSGYILTNHHVIKNASTIKVTFTNNKTVEAKLLGSDEYFDIAVLSIDKEYVTMVAEIGDSTKSSIGDTVFTVGSPLGSEYMGTVTKGILSGTNRQISVSTNNGNYIMDVLQTDAAINSGNSGGPLVNINGEVIGITSMKLVKSGVEGMGFALPIEYVMNYVDDLENGKQITRPVIGVSIIDSSYVYRGESNVQGVVVASVENGSSAYEAGLKKGDIVTKINDSEISSSAEFRYNLYKYNVGDTIKLVINRSGETLELNVKLN